MEINAGKCHLLVSTNNTVKIKTGNFDITNSKSEKLLGVKFDHKLSFDDDIFRTTFKGYLQNSCNVKSSIVYEYFKKTYSYECVH